MGVRLLLYAKHESILNPPSRHEMNWYFTKGSDDENPNGKGSYYVGTPAQYIEAWKVMYNTIKPVLPSVRFFWSPNVSFIAHTSAPHVTHIRALRSIQMMASGSTGPAHNTLICERCRHI